MFVRVRVRVRFAFCTIGSSFTEYIHAASFSTWRVCVRELMLYLIWLHWMRHWGGACIGAARMLQGRGGLRVGGARLEHFLRVRVRVRVRV